MIYLDNASTTMPYPDVVQAAEQLMRTEYFNPSALYREASNVRRKLEDARTQLAGRLQVRPNEIVFTSGATESNNWALRQGFKNKKGNIVVSEGEHPSVYETAVSMKNYADVRFVGLTAEGYIDAQKLMQSVDENTALVSIMHVSNETGAVNDIKRLNSLVKSVAPKAVFHSDGVQAFGKIPVSVDDLGVDLYSISAHKIGGLKGCGALVKRISLAPLLTGGGQESGLRSGTENTIATVAFGIAATHSAVAQNGVFSYMRDMFGRLDGVRINTPEKNSGSILSVSVSGIKSEILQHMLSDEGILIGLGSACSSKKSGNRVLSAMGLSSGWVAGNIRLSFSPATTLEECKYAMSSIVRNIEKLRGNICG